MSTCSWFEFKRVPGYSVWQPNDDKPHQTTMFDLFPDFHAFHDASSISMLVDLQVTSLPTLVSWSCWCCAWSATVADAAPLHALLQLDYPPLLLGPAMSPFLMCFHLVYFWGFWDFWLFDSGISLASVHSNDEF